MSVCLEGNVFIDGGQSQNINIIISTIGNCNISKSSLDMLSSTGSLQNITNVKNPINQQDAATKKYVDDLGIVISEITLLSTNTTTISNNVKGSYIITISNLIENGPSGIFHITKNEQVNEAHIVRTAAAPGASARLQRDIHPHVALLPVLLRGRLPGARDPHRAIPAGEAGFSQHACHYRGDTGLSAWASRRCRFFTCNAMRGLRARVAW